MNAKQSVYVSELREAEQEGLRMLGVICGHTAEKVMKKKNAGFFISVQQLRQ